MSGILFVCTANICRSPMAEVLFNDWLKRNAVPGTWWVGSAGTWAREGALAAPLAQEVMAERGLDLSRHRARNARPDLVAANDLILCMTRSHQEAMRAEFPRYAARVRLLTEMVGRPRDVLDPYGGDKIVFIHAAGELADLIERAGPGIVALAAPAP